jgi:hypothetical protein
MRVGESESLRVGESVTSAATRLYGETLAEE